MPINFFLPETNTPMIWVHYSFCASVPYLLSPDLPLFIASSPDTAHSDSHGKRLTLKVLHLSTTHSWFISCLEGEQWLLPLQTSGFVLALFTHCWGQLSLMNTDFWLDHSKAGGQRETLWLSNEVILLEFPYWPLLFQNEYGWAVLNYVFWKVMLDTRGAMMSLII